MSGNMENTLLSIPGKKLECINDEYKLNGESIKDEDGVKITGTEKINRYIGELVLNFCKPTDNIVLLAGAGASVVTDDKGNIDTRYGLTMRELRQMVFKELDEKSKSNEIYNFEKLSEMISFLPVEDEVNLEEFLSALIESKSFIKKEEKNTKNQLKQS